MSWRREMQEAMALQAATLQGIEKALTMTLERLRETDRNQTLATFRAPTPAPTIRVGDSDVPLVSVVEALATAHLARVIPPQPARLQVEGRRGKVAVDLKGNDW